MQVIPYSTSQGEVIFITPPKACDRLIFHYLIDNKLDKKLALSLITYRYPVNPKITLKDEDYDGIFELAKTFNQELKLPTIPESVKPENYDEYDCDVKLESTGNPQCDELADLIVVLGAETALKLYFSVDISTIQQVLNRYQQWQFWQNPDNRKKMKKEQEMSLAMGYMGRLRKIRQSSNVEEIGLEDAIQISRGAG